MHFLIYIASDFQLSNVESIVLSIIVVHCHKKLEVNRSDLFVSRSKYSNKAVPIYSNKTVTAFSKTVLLAMAQ